jgi:exopolysaccharide biosynthesis polyprenyl glycosylphosphotransferase
MGEKMSSIKTPLNHTRRHLITTIGLLAGDTLVIGLAYWLAYVTRFIILEYPATFDPGYYQTLFLFILPASLLIFWFYKLYSPKILFGGLEEYSRIFNAITIGSVYLVFLDFILRRDESISRGWLLLFWLFGVILAIGVRFTLRRVVYWMRNHGHLLSPTILVGADQEGIALLENLRQWRHSGLSIIGFVDDGRPPGSVVEESMRVLGRIEDLERLVQAEKVAEVIVATGSLTREQLLELFRLASWNPNLKLRLSSGLFEIVSTGLHIKELASVPLIEFNKTRITGLNAVLKSILDILIALVGLVVLAPFLSLIAILIRVDSPGPVIYRHRVVGAHGKEFDAFKFRTMDQGNHKVFIEHPELGQQFEENYKLKDDPRVTRLGRFLRTYSIDELPQFLNVLRGEMSIVGPRFISPPEMEKYGRWYINLFTVKPGITGLWQVSGRSDISYEERVRLDMYYIRNWSIWLDIYLMISTIPAVLTKKGAY